MRQNQYDKLKILYKLLDEGYKNNKKITREEILKKTSWKKTTFNTYYNKKLKDKFLVKSNSGYIIKNFEKFDEESFLRIMSQNQKKNEAPFKKELKDTSEQLLNKAIESAYLAVDIYNRPQTKFRTNGYVVMMIIAWTALLHSIFEENNIDYYYKNKDGSFKYVDGDKKAWELSECINHTDKIVQAVKDNLKFMIGLRNKIEHRFIPELDMEVCGECQAMLLNFERLLVIEYGKSYSLSCNIAIPLQIVNFDNSEKKDAMKEFCKNNFDEIKNYICDFRNALSDDVYNDMRYSFKVFLVPKLKNNKSLNDMSIEFINMKDINNDDYDQMINTITLIKEKNVERSVVNKDNFKPSQVCSIVAEKINKEFKLYHHTNAWKYFKVRKKGNQSDGCNDKYCQYDYLHKDYSYTKEWVDFLIEQLSDIAIYESIINFKER